MTDSDLEWELHFEPEWVRLDLRGNLVERARSELESAVEALLLVARRVVIDLASVQVIDGDGLNALIALADELAAHDVPVSYLTTARPAGLHVEPARLRR